MDALLSLRLHQPQPLIIWLTQSMKDFINPPQRAPRCWFQQEEVKQRLSLAQGADLCVPQVSKEQSDEVLD